MSAGRFDIKIEKGAKYFQAFDIELDDTTPVSLVGKTVECKIKESVETETNIFHLTEANGGILILDDANGRLAVSIDADLTGVEPDYGVYSLYIVTTADPEDEIEHLLYGKVTFMEGAI